MRQPMIVGKAALIVVDIQQGGAMPADEVGIAHMEGVEERVERAERLVAAAREAGLPIVFFQEVHRPSGVDFGRELDGAEGRHCVAGAPGNMEYLQAGARRTTDEVVAAFARTATREPAGAQA